MKEEIKKEEERRDKGRFKRRERRDKGRFKKRGRREEIKEEEEEKR